MKARSPKLVRLGFGSAAVLVVVLCVVAVRSSSQFLDASGWVTHTTLVMNEIRTTRGLLGVPGSHSAANTTTEARVGSLLDQLDHVAQLTADNPHQQANIRELRRVLSETPAAGSLHQTALDPATFEAAYLILDRMQGEEYRLLTNRNRAQADATRHAAIAIISLCVALLLLGLTTALIANAEFRRRAAAELTLLREKQELTRHTRELSLVSAGSELIQAARDEEQINAAVEKVLSELLPGSTGYFGITSPSNDLVEICGSWGSGRPARPFPPSSCMALELGHSIHRSEDLIEVTCAHAATCTGDYLCMPVRGAAGHLGVLHVESTGPLHKKRASAVALFAAQVALGLTNLRMREALRSQTIRDPLTSLFNRRYFDETLARELTAARRNRSSLSVLMIDVDHFKKLNDSCGHAAGDDALRSFARLMQDSFRESDVVCRYGGEEFAVILGGACEKETYDRAESFRRLVEHHEFVSDGLSLGRITTSVGLASCNDFDTPDAIVQAADAALYQAKRSGRNKTCIWTAGTEARSVRTPPALRSAPRFATALQNPLPDELPTVFIIRSIQSGVSRCHPDSPSTSAVHSSSSFARWYPRPASAYQ